MAWYYGTYSCGHEGRVNIVGPTKDRQWKADRYFSELCPECKEKERERETEEAKKKAAELELPALKGSEKQVAWAYTLRQKFIDFLDSEEAEDGYEYLLDYLECSLDELLKTKSYILETKTSAKWYIDTRFSDYRSILLMEMDAAQNYDPVKQQQEKELEKEIKAEATVLPENKITDTVAEFEVSDNVVRVYFEKNEDFRQLVKRKGYYWEKGAWNKNISETTGTAEERIAELGNILLNMGIPVRIYDPQVRENAINGVYEPECTRWVYGLTKSDKLAIKWDGYDDSLYREAKSLPGAKWNSGSMVVNVGHYKEVEDFAYANGFKFTKFARKKIEEHIQTLEKAEVVKPAPAKTEPDARGLKGILESDRAVLPDLMDND